MKRGILFIGTMILVIFMASVAFCAYHHEGEKDADKFLAAYPYKAGSKLDHCSLCHCGGKYEKKPGKWVSLGSCQWCHYSYGYDGHGNINDTMNPYGNDYHDYGRNSSAIIAIDNLDSDVDGYPNKEEIEATTFPGNPDDYPGQKVAPFRIYTKVQIESMTQHSQFMLMNASRSDDDYVNYTGLPIAELLEDAGMLDAATGLTVFAPDGWSNYYSLTEDSDPEIYHILGTYPESFYYYSTEADMAINPAIGWCDYSAPSCQGRNHLDPIEVSGGLKAILAYKRDGSNLDPGVLNEDNKLDGEGPYRIVLPQKHPCPPDQRSTSPEQEVIWPYNYDWDHNKGAATRSATIIRVDPLPEGCTDIDVLEAGWAYVDQAKIVVYGNIDGTDSNGNGVLDSEERENPPEDFNGDGILDYQDPKTTRVREATGNRKILLDTPQGAFVNVKALDCSDPAVSQKDKPSLSFPYGCVGFEITGLTPGESVSLTIVFPQDVPTSAKYYKINDITGWHEIPFGSNDGDDTITLNLTDGDPQTDSDGVKNGTIVDPGALAVAADPDVDTSSGGGGCFIATSSPGFHLGQKPNSLYTRLGLTLMIFSLGFLSVIALNLSKNRSKR